MPLIWEPVWTTSFGDHDVWVFADGVWELNHDGNDLEEGRADSLAAAKREVLGGLARHLVWQRGARYLGHKYSALIAPPCKGPHAVGPTAARWEVVTSHRDHPITSWCAGKLLAQGSAPNVRNAQRMIERLLQRPKKQWQVSR